MKELTMYIRPDKLETVKEILRAKGCHGMSVMSVMGCGIQDGDLEVGTRTEYKGNVINLIPKIKVEAVVREEVAEDILFEIHEKLSTGNPGDGKVFVKHVENAMRVRTGERGSKVL